LIGLDPEKRTLGERDERFAPILEDPHLDDSQQLTTPIDSLFDRLPLFGGQM